MSLFKGEDSVTQIDIACVDARLFVSNQVILVSTPCGHVICSL